jgi:hypothetical protein
MLSRAARAGLRKWTDTAPIPAVGLEDVGDTDPDILAHSRGAERNVKGRWIIDLILGT